jgi:nitroimidazol reductase NimA-like FMN-containing flavoprotein (pyridoxamine 5'-phosphate oxidase superfamily)
MTTSLRTSRTELRRRPDRGSHDREVVNAILDEALVCHAGFVSEGQPYVIPSSYARIGDALYLHGAVASRMCRALEGGAPVCVTVTLLDGLVLARAAAVHSVNYRSVVILGRATLVSDAAEKLAAMRAIVEHAVPGRWDEVRPPGAPELAGTAVLRIAIEEGSAKIRRGPPVDAPGDLDRPVWAGVLPLALAAGEPLPDAGCEKSARAVPSYLRGYGRRR